MNLHITKNGHSHPPFSAYLQQNLLPCSSAQQTVSSNENGFVQCWKWCCTVKMGWSLQVERMWIALYLLCPSCSQTLIFYCIIMTSLNEHLAVTSSGDRHCSGCRCNFPNVPHFLCHTEVEQSSVLVTSWHKGEAWAPMYALAKDYTECQLSSDSFRNVARQSSKLTPSDAKTFAHVSMAPYLKWWNCQKSFSLIEKQHAFCILLFLCKTD